MPTAESYVSPRGIANSDHPRRPLFVSTSSNISEPGKNRQSLPLQSYTPDFDVLIYSECLMLQNCLINNSCLNDEPPDGLYGNSSSTPDDFCVSQTEPTYAYSSICLRAILRHKTGLRPPTSFRRACVHQDRPTPARHSQSHTHPKTQRFLWRMTRRNKNSRTRR